MSIRASSNLDPIHHAAVSALTAIGDVAETAVNNSRIVYDFYAEDPVRLPAVFFGWPLLLLGACASGETRTARDAGPRDAGERRDVGQEDVERGRDGGQACNTYAKIGSDVRVTNAEGLSGGSSLVWTGSEYGVVWADDRDDGGGNDEIYFRRISEDGVPLDTDIRIIDAESVSDAPSLVWSGREYAVSWSDDRNGVGDPTVPLVIAHEIYFKRISQTGVPLGPDVRVTNDTYISLSSSLVWTGAEYAVSWTDDSEAAPSDLYFRRVSESGELIGSEMKITNSGYSTSSGSLVWTGTEFGLSWVGWPGGGTSEIYFGRLSPLGVMLGVETRVTNAPDSSFHPSLVWTGNEYGVSWEDYRDDGTNSDIYFTRISVTGALLATEIRITDPNPDYLENALFPSLVWAGSEYAISWQDDNAGSIWNDEIYFNRISESGALLGPNVRITNDENFSAFPSLVWAGRDYGVSWEDDRDGNPEIYFARIGCRPE